MTLADMYYDHKGVFWLGVLLLVTVSIGVPIFMTNAEKTDVNLLWVSGTEYIGGEPAQAIVRLVNHQNQPINASCTGTVLYPNKTVYFTSAMSLQSPFHNYYMTFNTPHEIGVYEEMAHCTYGINKEINNTQTFHISNSTNVIRRDISLGTNLTIRTINNQTILINTSFETIQDLIIAINQTGLNQEILDFLQINVTDYQEQILNNTEEIIETTENIDSDLEYQIGYNETNQSIKSLLLQIWQNLTYTEPEVITLTVQAPDTTIKNFQWYIKAQLTNQHGAIKTGSQYYCYVETSLLGNLTMPYHASVEQFINITTATTTGINDYVVKCNPV